ncbi:hypothetical protein AUP68_07462 [Ilyonectria robusta]
MSDFGIDTGAGESVSISNHGSPESDPAITFDTTLETSLQAENDEPDPVGNLAQELAEQLVKFQGCCNNCHQAAQRNHMEDPNEQISLAMYLEFAPELGPDVLGTETIARQKDDLAGKMSPESRREAFCGLDFRAEYIDCLISCAQRDWRITYVACGTVRNGSLAPKFPNLEILTFPESLMVSS